LARASTLDDFLRPHAVLVVWTDCQKAQARESVYKALERRGFSIEVATVRADGSLVSARRRELRIEATIVPQSNVLDGINVVRRMLGRTCLIHKAA
jgi:hypothetical protein